MTVIIHEIDVEATRDAEHEGGGEGEPRPTEARPQQALIDLLELNQERRDRLAID